MMIMDDTLKDKKVPSSRKNVKVEVSFDGVSVGVCRTQCVHP